MPGLSDLLHTGGGHHCKGADGAADDEGQDPLRPGEEEIRGLLPHCRRPIKVS